MIEPPDFTQIAKDARSLAESKVASNERLEDTVLILCECVEILQKYIEIQRLTTNNG